MRKMINKTRFSLSLILALSLVMVQVGGVLAAPDIQSSTAAGGIVQSITLEMDPTTGVTIVSVGLMDSDQALQQMRVSLEAALTLGLVVLNGDGKPEINNLALGKPVEIDLAAVIPNQEENQHPVANALATFFSDIAGIEYETIMDMHEQGIGFGVIAQSLWLTQKLDGDSETVRAIVDAKQTGDFSAFTLEDGTIPQNWGQLRKAILDKKNGLKIVPSDEHSNSNGNNSNNGNGNNGGNGNGNSNGGGNGNGNGNGGGNGGGNGNGNGNGGNRDKGNGNNE